MKKNIFYTLCLLFLVGNLYSQQTVWVKATASGTGDGSSEANAYGSFTTAFVQINSATDILRVVGNVPASGQSLNKNFAYTIEGDAGGSTLTGTAGAVRMFTNNTASTASQNVTFKNIKFTGAIGSTGTGGGVLLSNQANTINFENCRFEGNSLVSTVTTGGGALYITNTTVTITDCLFKENTALSKGGAIGVGAGAKVTLTRTTFYKNKTTSTVTGTNVNAGALYVIGTGAVVNAYNCTFFQNTTGTTNQDYGVIRTDAGTTKVYNSLFYDNKLNTDASAAGDWGSPASIGSTLTKSLAQRIGANVTNTNSTVNTTGVASSSLTYDDTSGKVKFGLAPSGDATPIAFGSDGKDVGAWDCGTRVAPTFTQVAAICSGATLSALPTTSTNGITGTWSPALNNTATTVYTFTPAVGQCASSTAIMTITVNSNVTPTFAQVAAICSGASLSALPTTSTNTTGITGTWSPALNNTATTGYTFTPTAGICATTATMTITVNPATTDGSVTVAEPTGSYTWALNSQTYTATGTYTYVTGCNTATLNLTTNVSSNEPTITSLTSDGTTAITQGCAGTTLVITGTNFVGVTAVTVNGVAVASNVVNSATQITATLPAGAIASGAVVVTTSLGGASTTGGNFAVNANVTPSFTQVAAICSGGSLSALPTTSTNTTGITGTWSPALNNAATTGYTFTPTAGQCATTAAMTITVNSNVTPTFTQVATICEGVSLSALPTTSTNTTGIIGSWSPALNNAATTEYTFTPDAGQCASTATMTITVNTSCTKTFTWNGSTSNDWATAANWTTTGDGPDTFPGQTKSTDIVVISNGGTPVVSSGTYGMISLAINNATGGNTGSILTINSGATLTVNNTSATLAAVAITLKGGSIVNNGTLNATATNTGASFGIACLVPSATLSSAAEYGYSGSGALNISTTQGNFSSGGIQFNGTTANTTYKMLFNGTTTFSLNNTAIAVYALRVVGGAKNPIIIGGTGFTLGTVGAPVNYGLLTMGNNGNNVTVDTGTTLTLNSAATNTAIGINIAQTAAASTDVNFTNKGTVAILGASSTAGIGLSIDNSTNVLPAINKINFENQGTLNVDLAIGSSSNSASLRVQGAGTTAGLATITNTGTGVLNLKNSQPYTAVTGCPIRIFATTNTPAVTIDNAGTLSFTGQSINFGGSATKSAINNTGIINSSSEFQSFTVTNGTAGTINFNYNTPATSRSIKFTVVSSAAAAAGATYRDVNSNVYTVVFTKVNGTLTELSGGFPLTVTPPATGITPATGTLTKTAGTGDATIAYSAITLYEASPLSASDSAFINNGTVNTGTSTNLNTFAGITTSETSVIDPGGASGKGIVDFSKGSTVTVNGTLKLQITTVAAAGITFDRITNSAASGGFNITNAILDVTSIITPPVNRTIDVLTTDDTGTLTGEFSSVTGLTPGWTVNYIDEVPGTPRKATFTVDPSVVAAVNDTYTDDNLTVYTITTAKIANTSTTLVTKVAGTTTTPPTGTLTKTSGSGTNSISYTGVTGTAAVASTAGKVQLVYSTENTWTGATSTAWATAANWSTGGVPISTSDVTIADVNNKPIIASNVSVASLTLNALSSLTVSSGSNLTVTGAVANNGTITVDNNANLIQTALTNTNSGSGTAIVKRNSDNMKLYDYTLWSSPVEGQDLRTFSNSTLATRFYTYNSATDLYNVVDFTNPRDFAPATGYLIRAPNNWVVNTTTTFNGVFTGVLNNGTKTLSELVSTRYYAVGNPYPSTINIAAFYTENPNAGTLYFWRRRNGDISTTAYATRNSLGQTGLSGGLAPSTDIAVGQGFIVVPGAATLKFTNAMRATPSTTAVFLRTTTEERSRFWLNLTTTSGVFSQMLVGYLPEATSGVDNAIDGKYINDAPVALTSIINAEEYTIQGRALPFATTDTVPLGFKTNATGNYTIAIDHVDGLFSTGQTVFLKDNLLNTVVDLSAGSYTFASAIGTFNSRFEVVYQSTLAVTNPTFTANSVIAFSENGEIRINSGSTIMDLVRVYDLQGRLLVEKKQINASETKLSTTATNQVLLVEITAANGSKITKKIIQ
jgi:hypothetical protein